MEARRTLRAITVTLCMIMTAAVTTGCGMNQVANMVDNDSAEAQKTVMLFGVDLLDFSADDFSRASMDVQKDDEFEMDLSSE